jgi:phosphoribulokinase
VKTALRRLKSLPLSTHGKPNLEHLKRLVRHWSQSGTGQEGVNRAVVRALDEIQNRLDALLRI